MAPLIIPFVLLIVMYFMVLRPNKQKMAARETMVSRLAVGDEVVSVGGIHGEVVEMGEGDTLVLQLEDGTRMRFDRRAMQQILDEDEDMGES